MIQRPETNSEKLTVVERIVLSDNGDSYNVKLKMMTV